MTLFYNNHNAYASSSTSTYPSSQPPPKHTSTCSSSHRKPKKAIIEDEEIPPPQKDKHKQQKQRNSYAPPILKKSNEISTNSRISSGNFIKSGVAKDEDETDDDEDAGKIGVVATSGFNKPRASHGTATTKYQNPSLLPFVVDDDDEEDFRPAKKPRPLLKKSSTKRAIAASGSEVVAKYKKKIKTTKKDKKADSADFSHASIPKKVSPKVMGMNNLNSSSGGEGIRKNPSRALPTPSRSSLRQVLAASVREVTVSREGTPLSTHEEKPFSYAVEDEDDEPLTDLEDSDDDAGMEKAEEKALREEFERGDGYSGIGTTGAESSEEEELTEESSEEDKDEGWEDRKREREEDRKRTETDFMNVVPNLNSYREGSLGYDESMEMEEEYFDTFKPSELTEIPETGGRGVVTWSDYDSVDHSEEDDDEGGEFEDELEELLALSEAVVGPVREDEYELGEMWFEEISNQGDDESGSAEEDNDELEEEETLIVQGWGKDSINSEDDSDNTDDMEGYQYYEDDGGDTTDSLDSDDHVGLIRFGIEVGSDSSEDSDDGITQTQLFSMHAPGTAAMAEIYAPTRADLASLPNYLFSGPVQDADVEEYSLDSTTIPTLPKIEPVKPTPIPVEIPKTLIKPKPRVVESRVKGGPPTMGSFMPKEVGKGTEMSVVIDESDKIAASPFSKVKKSKKRSRELLESMTPSRRSRADSKVSTTSGGRSVTDGSNSGEVLEIFSPILKSETVQMGLDDLLDYSVRAESSEDGETEGEMELDGASEEQQSTKNGLNDLSRWNRIPIGSFRTSTMPTFSPGQFLKNSGGSNEFSIDYSGRRSASGEGLLGSTITHTLSPRLPELSSKLKRKDRRSISSITNKLSPASTPAQTTPRSQNFLSPNNDSTNAFLSAIASPLFTSTTSMNSIVPPFLLD